MILTLAAEFQVILSMKEHLKKQDETIRKLTTQAEDLAAKVEVENTSIEGISFF